MKATEELRAMLNAVLAMLESDPKPSSEWEPIESALSAATAYVGKVRKARKYLEGKYGMLPSWRRADEGAQARVGALVVAKDERGAVETETTDLTHLPFAAGMRVRIEKGCAARQIAKNATAQIIEVAPLGADHDHNVKVVLHLLNGPESGRKIALYARHVNRLADAVLSLNDGNPLHKIQLTRAAQLDKR
jgi:hypothetical protein